jgi:hypothetical protein
MMTEERLREIRNCDGMFNATNGMTVAEIHRRELLAHVDALTRERDDWKNIVYRDLRSAAADLAHPALDAVRAEGEHLKGELLRVSSDRATLDGLANERLDRALSAERDVSAARRLLFLTHPCDGKYGDDGELQCGQCMIDFKRDPIDVIDAKIVAKNLARYL